MTKKLFLPVLFGCTLVFSQQRGTTYLSAFGGIEKNGFTISANIDTHTSTNNFLRFGVETQIEKYSYEHVNNIPVFVGYFTSSYYSRIFSLNQEQDYNFYLGGGVLMGYEIVNNKDDIFYQNGDFAKKERFIYGATAGGQFDIYLWGMDKNFDKGVSMSLGGGINYYINSKVGTTQPYAKIGLKIAL